MEITVEEKRKIQTLAENFMCKFHIGLIAVWLVICLPVIELLYLFYASQH